MPDPEIDDNQPAPQGEPVSDATVAAAIAAERRARRTTTAAIVEDLGVTIEEAKAIIAAQKAAQDADATETDKARRAQAEAEATAATATATAHAATARANAVTALTIAKLDPAHLTDGLRLIDIDAEDLDAEIEGLKTRLPALFATGPGTTPPPSGITPPNKPQGNGTGKTAKERALERFTPRHAPPAA